MILFTFISNTNAIKIIPAFSQFETQLTFDVSWYQTSTKMSKSSSAYTECGICCRKKNALVLVVGIERTQKQSIKKIFWRAM